MKTKLILVFVLLPLLAMAFNPIQSTAFTTNVNNAIYVFPSSFGSVGDGVTDDTVALQKTANFTLTNTTANAWVVDGQGKTYSLNGLVSFTNAHVTLQNINFITTSKVLAPLIMMRGDHSVCRNIQIQGAETNSTGSSIGLKFLGDDDVSFGMQEPTMEHVVVNNFATNVYMVYGVHFQMHNCQFSCYGNVGLYYSGDEGNITGNTIEESYGTTNGTPVSNLALTNSVCIFLNKGIGNTIGYNDLNHSGRILYAQNANLINVTGNNTEALYFRTNGDMYFTNCVSIVDDFNSINSVFGGAGVPNTRAYYDQCAHIYIRGITGDQTNETFGGSTTIEQFIGTAQVPACYILQHAADFDAGTPLLAYGVQPDSPNYFSRGFGSGDLTTIGIDNTRSAYVEFFNFSGGAYISSPSGAFTVSDQAFDSMFTVVNGFCTAQNGINSTATTSGGINGTTWTNTFSKDCQVFWSGTAVSVTNYMFNNTPWFTNTSVTGVVHVNVQAGGHLNANGTIVGAYSAFP